MGVEDLTYDDEQQLRRELVEEEYNVLNYVRQATKDQADIMDDLVAFAPHAPGEVLYPLAQSVRTGQMTLEQASSMAVDTVNLMATKTIERQPQNKNWWDKVTETGFEGIKKATKYGVAALEFLPQTVTNLASRNYGYAQQGFEAITGRNFGQGQYQKPDTNLFDGLFASTDIGALLSGAESGNGYFIGEAAKEFQEERARAYRGSIEGETWTIGRGFANTGSQPDSQMFNIVSGLVDAAAAIAIPSIPGSKTITATARTAASPLGKADEAAQGAENPLRNARRLTALPGTRRSNLAGITYSSRPHIDRSSVSRWLESNEGKAVKDRLRKVNSIEEAADMFRNADADFWLRLTQTQNVDDVDVLLRDRLGLQGLARTDDLRIGRMFDRRRARFGIQGADTIDGAQPGRVKSGFQSWYARNFTPVPGREMVVVSDDIRDLTQTVRNARDYLRTLRVSPEERETVLKQITESLLTRGVEGNIQDAMKALDNVVIRQLSLKNVSSDARRRIRAGEATAEDNAALETATLFHRHVFGKFRNDVGDFDLYGTIDESAHTQLVKGLNFTEDGKVIVDAKGDLESATAHIPSEMRKLAGYMPDARRVRRASARYDFMWRKHAQEPEKWGDPRLLTAFMDKVQQDIWRPATLMTGGYMFRNMLESVMRSLATPGIKAGPLNPLEWMRAVSKSRYGVDVNGADFARTSNLAGRVTNAEYVDATNAKPREAVDIIDIEKAGHRSGHYELISKPVRAENNPKYVPGVANELRLLASTPLGRIAADVLYQNGSKDEAIRVLREWLSGADDGYFVNFYGLRPGAGKDELARINTLWQNKLIRRQDTGELVRGSIKFVDESGNIDMENLSAYLEQVIVNRVQRVTGNNRPLLSMIADSVRTSTFRNDADEIQPSFLDVTGRGAIDLDAFDYSEEMLEQIRKIAFDTELDVDQQLPNFVKSPAEDISQLPFGKTGNAIGDAWRRTVNHFFANVFSKKEAFLNRSPVFRQYYYLRIDDLIGKEGSWGIEQGAAQDIIRRIEQSTVDIAEQRVSALKSISRRTDEERFWNGERITREQYNQLVSEADEELRKAREVFNDDVAAKYVGSRDLWEKIKARAADETVYDDALDIEQLDIASKAFALEETKEVFFNAADKSNFADILRIAVPFGPAWAEMTKFYYKQVMLRPNRIKNMGVTAQGFRDMDPDGDGKGFIYRDPTSGEMVFNYPFSDWMIPFISAGAGAVLGETFFGRRNPVAGALSGAAALGTLGAIGRENVAENLGNIKPELVAPVRSISMSFQVIPGAGPSVQIAANKLLGSRPEADQLMEILTPFGPPDGGLSAITPAWLDKVVEAVHADPENDRMYADLLMDSYRALYTTGNYDNTDEQSMIDMDQDAQSLARHLLAYRGFAQFLGPVRGRIQFNIPTDFDGIIDIDDEKYDIEGDYIPNALLSATFRAMQESDYENSVSDFLRTFGPHVMMYTTSKTRTKSEGLDASEQFGDWERSNAQFAKDFDDVFGYFAPVGSEFDLQTYLRQLEQGTRERITDPRELRANAEAVVGRALYMDYTRELPDKLTDAAEMELRMYRELLKQNLPGYEFQPLNVRRDPQILDRVIRAAQSPLMDGNRVAIPARLYIEYRNEVLAEARDRNNNITPSLGAKKYADLRRILRQYGDQLVGRYPEFERLYSRVFFEEVDAL